MKLDRHEPIEVHGSPLPDQAWSGLRTVVMGVSAFALGRGWIQNDEAALLATVVGVVWPVVAGQLKIRKRARELARMTKVVPDHIAKLRE